MYQKLGWVIIFRSFLYASCMYNQQKGKHHSISYRSLKNFDEAKFFSDLKAVPTHIIHLFDDTNDILDAWSDLFFQVVHVNVPIKQHRVKYKNQPQWITPPPPPPRYIWCHKVQEQENEFKYWRKKVTNMIKKAKQEKYQIYIETNKGKPGIICKLFQEASHILHKKRVDFRRGVSRRAVTTWQL